MELNCCISLNEIWDFSSSDLRFILFNIRYDYNFIIIIHLLGVMNVLLTLSKSVSFLVASYIKLKKVFSLILSTNSTNSLLMNIYLEFFKSGYTTLKSHNLHTIIWYLWSRRSCEFCALSSSCSSSYWNSKLALSSTLSRYSDNSCPVITSWII